MAYASILSTFANAKISAVIVDAQISAAANSGRIPQPAIEIAAAIGFELPTKPVALILALNAAENSRPFNTKKGRALLVELFAMAQAIADSGKVKNLPALVLPEWIEAADKAADEKAAKKAADKAADEKAAKKAADKAADEKAAKKAADKAAPAATVLTLDDIKAAIAALPEIQREAILTFTADTLGLVADIA